MTWNPISTAPKNGDLILVFCPNMHEDDQIISARWDAHYGQFEFPSIDLSDPQPTHWQPLPAPPAGEKP